MKTQLESYLQKISKVLASTGVDMREVPTWRAMIVAMSIANAEYEYDQLEYQWIDEIKSIKDNFLSTAQAEIISAVNSQSSSEKKSMSIKKLHDQFTNIENCINELRSSSDAEVEETKNSDEENQNLRL